MPVILFLHHFVRLPTIYLHYNFLESFFETLLTLSSYIFFNNTFTPDYLKSHTAYYLMLLYITIMLKPLIPLIADVWEHDFNEIEHLLLVHGDYGNHHLQKEIADSTSNDDHHKNTDILRSEDKVQLHVLVDSFNPDFNTSITETNFALLRSCILPSVVISQEGPPPKFAL